MLTPQLSLKLVIALVTLTVLGCQGDDERSDDNKEITTPASGDQNPNTPQTSEPVSNGNAGPGVSPDSCTQAGTAWVAAPGQNAPSACGAALAAFKPCLDQVTARFPAVAQAVEAKHKEYVDSNKMLLYAVSEANGEIVMHYVKQQNAGFAYANISFKSFKVNPAKELAACTQEHNAVPGLNGAPEEDADGDDLDPNNAEEEDDDSAEVGGDGPPVQP